MSTKTLPDSARVLKWSPHLHFERVMMRQHHGATAYRVKCPKCGREINEEKVAAHLEAHDKAADKARIESVLGKPVKPLPGQCALPGMGVEDVPKEAASAPTETIDVWADEAHLPHVGRVAVKVVARSGPWVLHLAPLLKREWEVTHEPTGRAIIRTSSKPTARNALALLSLTGAKGEGLGSPIKWKRAEVISFLRSETHGARAVVLTGLGPDGWFRPLELGIA